MSPFIFAKNDKYALHFTDVSEITGIAYKHISGAFMVERKMSNGKIITEESRYMPETMGSGIVLFDYDNDNDLDVFINNSSSFNLDNQKKSTPILYENLGQWQFKKVDAGFAVDSKIKHGMGAIAADYDGDGYQDLLLTGIGGPWLYKNIGNKQFKDISLNVGIKPQYWQDNRGYTGYTWSTGAVFFDADGDLDLDLFVINYVKWSPEADIYTTYDAVNKGYTSPRSYEGSKAQLYLQDKGSFILQENITGSKEDIEGKSLGIALWDFNNDNKLDIVVANDTEPNFYLQNLGNGLFSERALETEIAYDSNGNARAGMGIDIANYLNTENSGVAVAIGNFQQEPTSFFVFNETNQRFQELSEKADVSQATLPVLTFGLSFADLDLDGWQDLVMANGHTEPKIQSVNPESHYHQAMTLLRNNGEGQFDDWSLKSGEAIKQKIIGRGLAVGDLDQDGDLDLVMTQNGGKLRLLRNDLLSNTVNLDSEANYLRVHLIGSAPNTNAIGAKLKLSSSDGLIQERLITTGGSYLSQSEFTQTFGLGKETTEIQLLIQWPDGETQTVLVDNINTTLEIRQRP